MVDLQQYEQFFEGCEVYIILTEVFHNFFIDQYK